jgi:hypothetical protein
MKLFLNNIFFYLALPLSLLFVVSYTYLNYKNNKLIDEYRIRPSVNTIIIGGSQVQMSIQDKLLQNTVNLSIEAESYQFSYYKLKRILQNNRSIKKIYLGISYFSFSNYYDDYIYEKKSKEIFSRYFFILPRKEKSIILRKSINNLSSVLRCILTTGFKNLSVKPDKLSFIGEYKNGYSNKKADSISIIRRIDSQFYIDKKTRGYSLNSLCYLDNIVQLCQSYHIQLQFLIPPLHPYYKEKIPLKFIQKYNQITKKYNLDVIDLTNVLHKDSCYHEDGIHVTEYGALLSTRFFKKKIESNNLNKF